MIKLDIDLKIPILDDILIRLSEVERILIDLETKLIRVIGEESNKQKNLSSEELNEIQDEANKTSEIEVKDENEFLNDDDINKIIEESK